MIKIDTLPFQYAFSLCSMIPCSTLLYGQEMQPPLNVVYILADDMGYGDVSCYSPDSKTQTPTLDSLAASGIFFTDSHSNSAVSTPTRYGTLTGRYAFRSTLKKGVLTGYSPPLIDMDRETVASFLKKHGYQTACIGKWHLGLNWTKKDEQKPLFTGSEWDLEDTSNIDYNAKIDGGPSACGFDYSCILPASLDMPPYVYIENDYITAPVNCYAPDYTDSLTHGYRYRHGDMGEDFVHAECLSYFTKKSVEYIFEASKSNKPYFLYYAMTAPHMPWIVQNNFKGKSQAGAYGDFVVMVDDAVRQICDAVRATGEANHTLIIFTTDNGAMWQSVDIDQTGHRANGVWSGAKSDLWEGGHRVPMIASCPRIISPRRTSDRLVSSTDLFATLAEMVHQPLPAGMAEDSYSYWDELCGEKQSTSLSRTSMIYHSVDGYFAYREGEWVLLDCKGSGGWSLPEHLAETSGLTQLYNLKNDTLQQVNLANDWRYRAREMKAELIEIIKNK